MYFAHFSQKQRKKNNKLSAHFTGGEGVTGEVVFLCGREGKVFYGGEAKNVGGVKAFVGGGKVTLSLCNFVVDDWFENL